MYTTRTTLLEKIAAGDEIGWHDFYRTYKPLVCAVTRKYGVPPSETDDIVQQTLLAVFHDGHFTYRRELHGKFRTWLGGIIRHKIGDYFRKVRRSENASANSPETCESEFEQDFLEEYRNCLLNMAREELRARVAPEIFETFELCLRGHADKEIAAILNVRANTVTVRKKRCTEIMNAIIANLNLSDSGLDLPSL